MSAKTKTELEATITGLQKQVQDLQDELSERSLQLGDMERNYHELNARFEDHDDLTARADSLDEVSSQLLEELATSIEALANQFAWTVSTVASARLYMGTNGSVRDQMLQTILEESTNFVENHRDGVYDIATTLAIVNDARSEALDGESTVESGDLIDFTDLLGNIFGNLDDLDDENDSEAQSFGSSD